MEQQLDGAQLQTLIVPYCTITVIIIVPSPSVINAFVDT